MHRDVKLENIMIAEKDDLNTVKLIDFGFACFKQNSGKQSYLGSPMYMSPEIIRKERYDVTKLT